MNTDLESLVAQHKVARRRLMEHPGDPAALAEALRLSEAIAGALSAPATPEPDYEGD